MKRTLTLSSVLLLPVLALVLLNAGFGSDVTTDPEISTIISQVIPTGFWTLQPRSKISAPINLAPLSWQARDRA